MGLRLAVQQLSLIKSCILAYALPSVSFLKQAAVSDISLWKATFT